MTHGERLNAFFAEENKSNPSYRRFFRSPDGGSVFIDLLDRVTYWGTCSSYGRYKACAVSRPDNLIKCLQISANCSFGTRLRTQWNCFARSPSTSQTAPSLGRTSLLDEDRSQNDVRFSRSVNSRHSNWVKEREFVSLILPNFDQPFVSSSLATMNERFPTRQTRTSTGEWNDGIKVRL